MDSTGPSFDLPCPSPNDYAALPLYMQRLAEEVEADQVALRSRISAAYRPPIAIWRRAPAGTVGFGSSGMEISFSAADLVFYKYLSLINQPPQMDTFALSVTRPGLWRLGWFANTQATGAVTAGSTRILDVGVGRQDPTGSSKTIVGVASRYVRETQSFFASGEFFGSDTGFVVDTDPDRYSAVFRFTHGNAASTVQVVSITAWLRFVGAPEPIEVT